MLIKEDLNDISGRSDLDSSGLMEQFNELKIGEADEDYDDQDSDSSTILCRSNPVFNRNRISSKVRTTCFNSNFIIIIYHFVLLQFEAVLNKIQEKVINAGEKAVVVSQFTSVLKLLEIHLSNRNINYLALTGFTKIPNRKGIVQDFNNNSDRKVYILIYCLKQCNPILCSSRW